MADFTIRGKNMTITRNDPKTGEPLTPMPIDSTEPITRANLDTLVFTDDMTITELSSVRDRIIAGFPGASSVEIHFDYDKRTRSEPGDIEARVSVVCVGVKVEIVLASREVVRERYPFGGV